MDLILVHAARVVHQVNRNTVSVESGSGYCRSFSFDTVFDLTDSSSVDSAQVMYLQGSAVVSGRFFERARSTQAKLFASVGAPAVERILSGEGNATSNRHHRAGSVTSPNAYRTLLALVCSPGVWCRRHGQVVLDHRPSSFVRGCVGAGWPRPPHRQNHSSDECVTGPARPPARTHALTHSHSNDCTAHSTGFYERGRPTGVRLDGIGTRRWKHGWMDAFACIVQVMRSSASACSRYPRTKSAICSAK